MERITYNLLTKTLTAPDVIVCNADNLTIELAIDSTGTGYETWEKRCDLAMSDGTNDILGFSPAVTDVIAVFTLTSAHLKKGALVINPYVQLNGARKGFPKKSVDVKSQLSNDSATASVQVIIEDYIDDRLTVKSVTATTLAPSAEATVAVNVASDGTSYLFGIPQGMQGIQGIQGLKGNQWRGAYSGATAYVVDDVVSYNGSAYICILASTNNLPTNATFWQLFATTGTAIASNVANTPAGGIAATTVQSAINELDTEKADKANATNLIANGNFESDLTEWTTGGNVAPTISTEQAKSATKSLKFNTTSQSSIATREISGTNGNILYYALWFYFVPGTNSNVIAEIYNTGTYTNPTTVTGSVTGGSWVRVSGLRTVAGGGVRFLLGTTVQSTRTLYIDDVMLVDLTAIFGAGKEPSATQMDNLLANFPNSWFNGTSEIGSIGALIRATLGFQVVTPTLLNSRTGTAQYVFSNDGLVIFRGTASGGSLNTNIFVLPENIRPITGRAFPISANVAFGVITVAANGEVRQIVGALTNVFLDGIVFNVGV